MSKLIPHLPASTIATIILALVSAPACAQGADDAASSLDRVLTLTAKPEESSGVPEIRAAALKELGRNLGLRAGLTDGSIKKIKEIDANADILNEKYNFQSLSFSNGALPPVIVEAKDVISVMDFSMRVANTIYKITSPASFRMKDWRDYLYLGLNVSKDPLVNEMQRSIYPRDAAEQRYWKKVVQEGYVDGMKEADKVFEVNLKRLEDDIVGMKRFKHLYNQKLVSAPAFASATQGVSKPDANTIIIGETVFRITAQPTFNMNRKDWKARK